MKPWLVVYHSGVGSTRLLAQEFHRILQNKGEVELWNAENGLPPRKLESYHGVIIGFPVYHGGPSATIRNFIKSLPVSQSAVKTFLFSTCGLYSANANRILAKQCRLKNMLVLCDKTYRCPASDGTLLFSGLAFLWEFGKTLPQKLEWDCLEFWKLSLQENLQAKLPGLKWYGAFNYPNRYVALGIKRRIILHQKQCIGCGVCVKGCACHCISMVDGKPFFDLTNCEQCYRCIHACPKRALSLHSGQIQKQLTAQYLEEKLDGQRHK